MRAPTSWSRGNAGLLNALLSPLGLLYGCGTALRRLVVKPWQCPVPVICVGNLIAGGTGKTPVAMDLAARLRARGITPHMVTRGYGGREKGPLRVSADLHDSSRVGDEPLLLSAIAPTWVAEDRRAACQAAVADGAECIIFDDGFQDPSVAKDLSLVVVDGAYGFGNGYMIPAGPLREPVAKGLSRANGVILIGEGLIGVVDQVAGHCPVLRANLEPGPEAENLAEQSVLAFAGIGRPEKFFHALRRTGCDVSRIRPFADHHNFTRAELNALKADAGRDGLALVTTAKDYVRIPQEDRDGIQVLRVGLVWENQREIDALLDSVLSDDI